jgi:hypothetical protein
VERIEQITRMVHGVVTGEFGKKLVLRNFIHRPSELAWMQEAIGNMKDIVFEAMSKDVPQDFEPYCKNGHFNANFKDKESNNNNNIYILRTK